MRQHTVATRAPASPALADRELLNAKQIELFASLTTVQALLEKKDELHALPRVSARPAGDTSGVHYLALLKKGKLVALAGRCIAMPTGLSAHFANCTSLVPAAADTTGCRDELIALEPFTVIARNATGDRTAMLANTIGAPGMERLTKDMG
ncbi:hypothetical protein T492DRAFT_893216 [Pavlovales sp. CCMP2436]|nr:hypothetical protein T492DRAFT_893216 [Pavlovales sp. CCMP2436]